MKHAPPTPDRLRRWDAALSAATSDIVVDRLLTLPPFRDMNPENFPRSIPLRDLLKNDTCIRRYRQGEIVVHEGDYGASAFMVLSGVVQVILNPGRLRLGAARGKPVRRGMFRTLARLWSGPREDEVARRNPRHLSGRPRPRRIVLQDIPRVLDSRHTALLESGEFFGESAALSRMPRPATIIAHDAATEILEIRWQGLRDLMRYDSRLREHIDQLYRQRALQTFLSEIPFMRHLSEAARAKVADAVQFETHGAYDWSGDYRKLLHFGESAAREPAIVAEGDYPNAVVVIRAGFARVTQRYGDGHRTLNYLGAGHLFGFEEIAHNWRHAERPVAYRHTLRVVGYTHVLVIPVPVIEEFVLPAIPPGELPPILENPPGARSPFGPASAQSDSLLAATARRRPHGPELKPGLMEFLAQNRYFNGTESMVIDLDRCTRCDDCVRACAATHDNNPRFLRHGAIHENIMIAQACMHCADPVCMIGCPTGAIHREESGGEVVIDPDTCIGCSSCANNCPYGAIRMVEVRSESGEILVASDARPILKATKCDLCVDQHGGPACVHACPHDAIGRLNLNTPDDLVAWLER